MSEPAPSLLAPTADEDIPCPLCGYNLRGLTEARCPECGARYEWWELREARDTAPIYEYRGTVGSLLGTLFKTLSPSFFWRTLKPTMLPQVNRLIEYAVVLLFAFVLAGLLLTVFNEVLRWMAWRDMGAGWRVVDTSFLGFIQSRDYLGSYLSDTDALRYAIFTILSMPIVLFMLFVSLCLGTLQKAKLRSEHIARVALYSSTPLLLGGFLSMLPVYVNDAEDYGSWYMLLIGEFPRRWNPVLALPILFAGILGTTLTLGIACRRYLQVRHAWGVALASGVVLSLVLSALVIALR